MATCRCQTSATPRPTPTEKGRPGAGIFKATSACRLLGFMGGHCPRTPQTPTGYTRRPPPFAAGRIGDRHTRQHASSGSSCPSPKGLSAQTLAGLLEEDAAAPVPHTARPAPGGRPGWQGVASKAFDKHALEMLFNDIDSTSQALLLSQGGDAASCAFTALPTSADTRVPDAEYRVMLLRKLRLPFPLVRSAVPAVDAWMRTATIARPAREWAC